MKRAVLEKNDRYLVVFDVEGVLLPKRRFLLFEVAMKHEPSKLLKFFFFGFLYEVGLLSIESALRRLFRLLRGTPIDEMFVRFRNLPLMYGAAELFENLRRLGFKTALISSGLPRVFVEDLAKRLGADYAYGLEIGIADGYLTGEVWGDVLERDGKAVVLKKVLEKEGLSSSNCAVVADDRNNLPMLRLSRISIGYNPDFILRVRSNHVIGDDLSRVLPLLTGKASTDGGRALSQSEVLREMIHISGILVPFVCIYLLSDRLVSLLILAFTSIYTASEVSRMLGKNLPIISTITLKAADRSELQEFVTRPIAYALGIASSLLLFRPPISYASIAILTLGDGSAAIFGKRLGRTVFPLNKGKRVEGSLFGFIFAFFGATLFISPTKALIGAVTGILAECLPSPIDDNVTIPLVSGVTLTLAA